MSEIARCHDLSRRSTIAGTADPARRIEKSDFVAKPAVQLLDPWRRLIHKNNRPLVPCQPHRSALLVVPREAVLCIVREFHVVGRIGIDEVVAVEGHTLYIHAGERPGCKDAAIRREIASVSDVGKPCGRPDR